MSTFEDIIDNALTSREEVEMVSNAKIGAEQDITDTAANVVVSATGLVNHARYQAFLINRNPGTNPFGLR